MVARKKPKPRPVPKSKREAKVVAPAADARGDELLAAVIASPADDAARVVYADHLLERGDPRGEFIHLQLLLRRVLKGASGYPGRDEGHLLPPDHEQFERRETALFNKHARMWVAPVRAALRTWFWTRGFLDDITAGASFFEGGGDELLRTHPVTIATFNALTPKAFARFARASFGTIRNLTVHGRQLTSKTVDALTGPNLEHITSLSFVYTELGAEGLAKLANSHLRSLQHLSISGLFGDAGLAALAKSTTFEALESLTLIDPEITDRGLMDFAAAPHFPRLRKVAIQLPTYHSTSPATLRWSRAGIDALVGRFGDASTETYYGKRIDL